MDSFDILKASNEDVEKHVKEQIEVCYAYLYSNYGHDYCLEKLMEYTLQAKEEQEKMDFICTNGQVGKSIK